MVSKSFYYVVRFYNVVNVSLTTIYLICSELDSICALVNNTYNCSVLGPSNSASFEKTFLLKDVASQTSKANEDLIETSVQAVASCTDAYTEPEVDSSSENNEPVTFMHKQKFVLPLIMIGVGFVLGN